MTTLLQNYTVTTAIPKAYFSTAAKQGTVHLIEYATHDYTQAARPAITKKAYVYLPYGYNADDTKVRYNTLFYMHGWTGIAGELFTIGNGFIKNMFDVMIEKVDIQPLIIVAATFDNDNAPQDFSRSVDELGIFHHDFRNALLPFIDSHFNTNAVRNSRAFSGFSLGAVTTWYEFCYNSDLIKYFLPLSGDCWIMGTYGGRYQPQATTDRLEQLVQEKGYTAADYEIYAAVGTRDPIWDQVNNQLTEMLLAAPSATAMYATLSNKAVVTITMQSPNICTTLCRCILDVSTCISQSINERQKQKQEHLYSRHD